MRLGIMKLWEAIKGGYFDIGKLIVLNLMWFLCSLTIILLPAATVALYYTTREMIVGDEPYSLSIFFRAIKMYILRAWLWMLPGFILTILFLANILFFAVENVNITLIVKTGNTVMLFVWLWFQTFYLALLMEQKEAKLQLALRNGLVIFIKKPCYHVVATLSTWLFMIASILLMMPWVIISISFLAYVQTYMLREVLAEMRGEAEEAARKSE